MSAPGSRGTVLVTGAAGAIGSRLLPLLRDDGWRTRALVHRRDVAGTDETVRGDLADRASLASVTDGVDAVVHLAAVTHARTARRYELNVLGTRALLDAVPPTVGRFVHISSRAIASDGGAYSRSKAAAEALVAAARVPWTILRLAEVFGGSSSDGVDDVIAKARRGAAVPVVASGGHVLCPLHVDDAARSIATALVAPAAAMRTYTLGGDCMTTVELVRRVNRVFGTTSRVVHVPRSAVSALAALARVAPIALYPDQLARLESAKSRPDAAATTDFGFAPRTLEDALRTSCSQAAS